MDYNDVKYEAFYDELEKIGWIPVALAGAKALGGLAAKALGGKVGAGLMGASMLAGKKGGQQAVKKPGFFSSIFKKRPRPPMGPRYV